MDPNSLLSGQLLKLLPESGYRYVGLEVRGLSLSVKLAYAVDPKGNLYLLGTGGTPLYLGEDANFFENAKLAAAMATSAFLAAKGSLNFGVSQEEVTDALSAGKLSAQISAHLGVGVNYDPISQTTEVTVGPGAAIPGVTANFTLGGFRVGSVFTHPIVLAAVTLDVLKLTLMEKLFAPRCFIAGTQILMADGSQKPIEEVDVDDMVMSFDPDAEDGLGASVPRRVTRTFTNVTRVLIDLWGLHVTPGHEFLADGGEFMKIADILRKDRCFVRQVDGKGVPFRARTNAQMKTLGDVLFRTRFRDPRTGAWRNASVRGSIPFERVLSDAGGVMSARMARLIEVLHHDGRLCVQSFASNGQLRDPKGRTLGVIEWPEGRTPFDAEAAENHVVLLDGAPFVPDWVKNIPRDGEELQAVMNAGGGADDRLLISPYGAFTVSTVNGQDQLNPPVSRQQLPPQRPDLRVVGKGGGAPAHQ